MCARKALCIEHADIPEYGRKCLQNNSFGDKIFCTFLRNKDTKETFTCICDYFGFQVAK